MYQRGSDKKKMENEPEAIYNLDIDRNLVIDDGNDEEIYDYNETADPDFVPEIELEEMNAEKQIEIIKTSLKNKSLSPTERGKKLAEFNKLKRSRGIDKKKPKSMSKKSGVIFPVKRVLENLKKMFPEKIISQQAGVYLASVLEYMSSEVLDLSGDVAREYKKKRITPHFIQLSINDDEELNKLLKDTIIAQGGVTPHIHPELLITKSRYHKKQQSETREEPDQELIKYKKKNMVENASQTEPLEEIRASEQIFRISRAGITQSSAMLSPDVTIVEEVPMTSGKKRKLSNYNLNTIQQSEITSAQVIPAQLDTCLELSEINNTIENITSIDLEQASTPTPREQVSRKEPLVYREQSLEMILETENCGNNSDKNASLNIESYLNVQASCENFGDKILNNRTKFQTFNDVTLQNILKPLENHILITDRKIVPNVLFGKSKFSKKRYTNSEN